MQNISSVDIRNRLVFTDSKSMCPSDIIPNAISVNSFHHRNSGTRAEIVACHGKSSPNTPMRNTVKTVIVRRISIFVSIFGRIQRRNTASIFLSVDSPARAWFRFLAHQIRA